MQLQSARPQRIEAQFIGDVGEDDETVELMQAIPAAPRHAKRQIDLGGCAGNEGGHAAD